MQLLLNVIRVRWGDSVQVRVLSTQGPQSQKVHTEKNPHVWCLSGQYGMRYNK